MIDEVYKTMKEETEKSNEALRHALSRVRTGRANAALLDSIRVDYYGSMTPLNQMATISTPEPRMIMVKPFDRTAVSSIEKAIQSSSLGLNPSSDAAANGLQRGDLIIQINQRPVTTPAEAAAAVDDARKAGRDTVLLLVQRGANPARYIGVKLMAKPGSK